MKIFDTESEASSADEQDCDTEQQQQSVATLPDLAVENPHAETMKQIMHTYQSSMSQVMETHQSTMDQYIATLHNEIGSLQTQNRLLMSEQEAQKARIDSLEAEQSSWKTQVIKTAAASKSHKLAEPEKFSGDIDWYDFRRQVEAYLHYNADHFANESNRVGWLLSLLSEQAYTQVGFQLNYLKSVENILEALAEAFTSNDRLVHREDLSGWPMQGEASFASYYRDVYERERRNRPFSTGMKKALLRHGLSEGLKERMAKQSEKTVAEWSFEQMINWCHASV